MAAKSKKPAKSETTFWHVHCLLCSPTAICSRQICCQTQWLNLLLSYLSDAPLQGIRPAPSPTASTRLTRGATTARREPPSYMGVGRRNMREWVIFQFRAAGLMASHQDIPQHNNGGDNDGRGKPGDTIVHGRGGIFGHDTVIDVSRPHTHDGAGHIKPRTLQACAGTTYTRIQSTWHRFFPMRR